MKTKFNIAVRETAEKKNMYLWQVAALMGISYSGFMQKMRYEWSQAEQERVIKLIEDSVKEGSSK